MFDSVSRLTRHARVLAACTAAVVASTGLAQVSRVDLETPVQLNEIPVLKATPRGFAGGVSPAACNGVASHTDANFGGGSFNIQAGFAQTEMFAATYTLLPSEFPIRIDLTEVILATSNANQLTVTQWSLLFYDGLPTTGTLIDTFSSNDIDLPHARVGPGTAGVNIQFGVDPGDPEQLIIYNANGTNKFTVAFRIDDHHNQTGNPCSVAPPTSSNAFPVTDTSGLSQPANNWLFGVNCGALGCPSNGGWGTFASLFSFCRPTGDWVSRTTWTNINCTPGIGSCCLPNGSCQVLTTGDCAAQGGTYRGDNTTCDNPCPAPTGACCLSNGFCLGNLTEVNCGGAGGTWAGPNVACGANNTCPSGRCCLPNGSCVVVTSASCSSQGGAFAGLGTNCNGFTCPPPTGACCLSNGFCLADLTQANCQGAGGTWGGMNSTCADNNSNGQADICEPDCPADFNQDATVDFFDYLDFVDAFSSNLPSADFNNDSIVDFFDYLDFVDAFSIGC